MKGFTASSIRRSSHICLSSRAIISSPKSSRRIFKIFRKIDDYRGDCSFNVFACRIAKNTYYSYLKKRRKQAPPPSAEIPDEGPSIEDRLDDKQLASKIHAVLHTLPEPYREVFWMRVFGELPFEEIARLHGRTESWARVTFHRAKLKIQEEL